jgi:hypothetical protein
MQIRFSNERQLHHSFYSRTVERMEDEGGSAAWRLAPGHAQTCHYLVCCWNTKGKFAAPNYGPGHREAFLVAPIRSIELAPELPEHRYIIRFAEFARVSVPAVWLGHRNPVNYGSLSELRINLGSLTFDPGAKRPAPKLPASSSALSNLR